MRIWAENWRPIEKRGGNAVLRMGLQMILCSSVLVLAGCVSPEDELAEGVSSARAAFEEEAPEPNEASGETELYVPGGYEVEPASDDHHVLITRGSQAFALFLNPNEAPDSTFFYDLQKANPEETWLADEKFSQHGRFGFVTVRTIAEDRYELVVSSGSAKLSTITEQAALRNQMEWMMKTARSIEAAQEE